MLSRHVRCGLRNPVCVRSRFATLARKLSSSLDTMHTMGTDDNMRVGWNVDGTPALHRVVLTGGPCGGKSTALMMLNDHLRNFGFDVYSVPEAATLLMSGGATWANCDDDMILTLQENLLRTQIALEERFLSIAQAKRRPAVILCDRGTMDGKAYCSDAAWHTILERGSWEASDLRESRYDCCVHMVTAAQGAEAFYTTANNAARHESPDQARDIDEKLQEAWLGHPQLFVVDNRSTDFQRKIDRALAVISDQVGIPSARGQRRFVVEHIVSDLGSYVPIQTFNLEKTYLKRQWNAMSISRLEMRGNRRRTHVYRYSTKRVYDDGRSVVLKRKISDREYNALRKHADDSRVSVSQLVTNFVWQWQCFSLVQTVDPACNMTYIEVTTSHDGESTSQEPIHFPPFLRVGREVTRDERWTSHSLSANPFRNYLHMKPDPKQE